LVTLAGFGNGGIRIPPAGQAWSAEFSSLHRVRKEIVRIQSRYVWNGGEGPWYEGVVQGGFAYTASFVAYAAGQYSPTPRKPTDKTLRHPGVQQEFRAFDSLGNPVPLQY
jgi:hypothetical protein